MKQKKKLVSVLKSPRTSSTWRFLERSRHKLVCKLISRPRLTGVLLLLHDIQPLRLVECTQPREPCTQYCLRSLQIQRTLLVHIPLLDKRNPWESVAQQHFLQFIPIFAVQLRLHPEPDIEREALQRTGLAQNKWHPYHEEVLGVDETQVQ